MKVILLVLCCVLQSIATFNLSDLIMYPPESISPRIVGGQDAVEGDAPYQCSLQLYKRHFCGCSVISKEWIITASHCVVGQSPQSLEVFVGSIDLKNGGVYYQVEKLIAHEKYNRPPFANDIALIRVQSTIQFNENVQPIELLREEVADGAELQLTGWGRLSAGGIVPQILQIINLKAVSTKRCRAIYGGGNVHASHICTLTKIGEGACNGDSGGPLVFEKKLVGVVNWGVPCALGYPDAFGKISYLHEWVDRQIKSN